MKILQENLQLTVIVDKFWNFFQNFYQKEVNIRALLSFLTFPVCKLEKLSYMEE